jgi:hypothetical protein
MSIDYSGMYDGTQSLSDLATAGPVIMANPSAIAAIKAINALDITQELDPDALAALCIAISKGVTFA